MKSLYKIALIILSLEFIFNIQAQESDFKVNHILNEYGYNHLLITKFGVKVKIIDSTQFQIILTNGYVVNVINNPIDVSKHYQVISTNTNMECNNVNIESKSDDVIIYNAYNEIWDETFYEIIISQGSFSIIPSSTQYDTQGFPIFLNMSDCIDIQNIMLSIKQR